VHALVPAIPAWVFTVVAFIVTTGFNLAGVEVAARVGRWVLIAELGVLALFVVAALVVLATHGPYRPLASPFIGTGHLPRPGFALVAQVMGAVAIAVNSFLGFDAIASFAEENAGDARQVGRAIAFCFVVAGVVFVLQSYLASVLSVATPAELAANPEAQGTAFYTVTRTAIGGWMATVIALTKAIGPAFAAMTGQAAAGRLLFGMARDGHLPRALSAVNPARGVPSVALAAAAALTLVVAVWAALRPDGLEAIVSIVNVGALVAFAMLHASVFAFYVWRRKAAATLAHWLIPVAGMAITIWVLASTGRMAQLIGVAWCVAGIVSLAASRRGTASA
jgi:amino acid transporter